MRALSDTEGTIREKRSHPPSIARNTSLVKKLEQEAIVRDSIESFDNVEKDDRELLVLAHSLVHIAAERVEVIECRQTPPEASLALRKEATLLKKVSQTLFHNALKSANDDARDRDDSV